MCGMGERESQQRGQGRAAEEGDGGTRVRRSPCRLRQLPHPATVCTFLLAPHSPANFFRSSMRSSLNQGAATQAGRGGQAAGLSPPAQHSSLLFPSPSSSQRCCRTHCECRWAGEPCCRSKPPAGRESGRRRAVSIAKKRGFGGGRPAPPGRSQRPSAPPLNEPTSKFSIRMSYRGLS